MINLRLALRTATAILFKSRGLLVRMHACNQCQCCVRRSSDPSLSAHAVPNTSEHFGNEQTILRIQDSSPLPSRHGAQRPTEVTKGRAHKNPSQSLISWARPPKGYAPVPFNDDGGDTVSTTDTHIFKKGQN